MKLDDLKARLLRKRKVTNPFRGHNTPLEVDSLVNPDGPTAAKAITDLEAQVKRLSGDGIHTCHDQCTRVACVLRREKADLEALVGELGEALRPYLAVLAEKPQKANWTDRYCDARDQLESVARATLAKLEKARG